MARAPEPVAPAGAWCYSHAHRHADPDAPPAPVAPPAYDETYAYDALGNLLSKPGVGAYSYGTHSNGTGAGPHQARTVNGATYSYDANGNLVSGGRSFTWNADNLPATVTNGGVTESYTYDADGERVVNTVSGVTTVYFGKSSR